MGLPPTGTREEAEGHLRGPHGLVAAAVVVFVALAWQLGPLNVAAGVVWGSTKSEQTLELVGGVSTVSRSILFAVGRPNKGGPSGGGDSTGRGDC